MTSAMTAPMTKAPPTSARSAGISWNASHTQKGISGVSSVAIRDACPDGNRREPRKNKVRPNATWKNPNIARTKTSAPVTAVMDCAKGMRRQDTDVIKPPWRLGANLLLHIRDSGGHAEFFSAHFGQHGNALADLLKGGVRKTQTQTAAGIGLVGGPFRPGVDGDAGGKC